MTNEQECMGKKCKYYKEPDYALCFSAGFLSHCGYDLKFAKQQEEKTSPTTEQVREQIARKFWLTTLLLNPNERNRVWTEAAFDEQILVDKTPYYSFAGQILSLIQPLIDQAVNHEANEWIVGISEALGRGYFVYDPKLGRTGSIKRALDRVIDQVCADERAKVLRQKEQIMAEAIKKFGYSADTSSLIEFLFEALKSG